MTRPNIAYVYPPISSNASFLGPSKSLRLPLLAFCHIGAIGNPNPSRNQATCLKMTSKHFTGRDANSADGVPDKLTEAIIKNLRGKVLMPPLSSHMSCRGRQGMVTP